MEGANALSIFSRSVKEYKMKYTKYVADGDVRIYQKLSQIYGKDESDRVHKYECWNHEIKNLKSRIYNKLKDFKPGDIHPAAPITTTADNTTTAAAEAPS